MLQTTRTLRTVLAAALATVAILALGVGTASAHGKRVDVQRSDVYTVAGLPQQVDVGDSLLVRTKRAVFAYLRTRKLPPGPHTMWWVVWNNPEACGDDGCNEADVGAPGVDVDIGYADGALVRRSGRATFVAGLREGPLKGFPHELGLTTGTGLADAKRSEIHLVLRSHGPKIRGLLRNMLTTFHGGCDYSVFGGVVPEGTYGIPGPNTSCTDVQFAVHP